MVSGYIYLLIYECHGFVNNFSTFQIIISLLEYCNLITKEELQFFFNRRTTDILLLSWRMHFLFFDQQSTVEPSLQVENWRWSVDDLKDSVTREWDNVSNIPTP